MTAARASLVRVFIICFRFAGGPFVSAASATCLLFIHANGLHRFIANRRRFLTNSFIRESTRPLRDAYEPTRDAGIGPFHTLRIRMVRLGLLIGHEPASIGAPASGTAHPGTSRWGSCRAGVRRSGSWAGTNRPASLQPRSVAAPWTR